MIGAPRMARRDLRRLFGRCRRLRRRLCEAASRVIRSRTAASAAHTLFHPAVNGKARQYSTTAQLRTAAPGWRPQRLERLQSRCVRVALGLTPITEAFMDPLPIGCTRHDTAPAPAPATPGRAKAGARRSLGADPLAGPRHRDRASWRTCWRWTSATATCASATRPRDAQIARYVDQLDFERDEVFGIFNRRLELVAMAHLAYLRRRRGAAAGRRVRRFGGRRARGRGYGDRLFDHAVLHARNRGIDSLLVHALSENTAMLRIARNAGATRRARRAGIAGLGQAAAGRPGVAGRSTGRGQRGRTRLPAEAAGAARRRTARRGRPRADRPDRIGAVAGLTSPRLGRSPAIAGAAGAIRAVACPAQSSPVARAARSGAPPPRPWTCSRPFPGSSRWPSLALLRRAAGVVVGSLRARRSPTPLPTEWTLTARPVFSTDERRVYRQLREALPHHIVLSKLPLVRFCQPTDPERGALLVRAARRDPRHLCHLQRQRPRARRDRPRHRPRQLAARAADQAVGARRLPRALPALPGRPPAVGRRTAVAGAAERGRRRAGRSRAPSVRPGARHAGQHRRPRAARERTALWQDSGFFQDSFFGADNRSDAGPASEFGAIGSILRSGVVGARGRPRRRRPTTSADRRHVPRTRH